MNLNRDNYIELPLIGNEALKFAPNFQLHEIASKDGDRTVRLHPYSPIMLQAIRDLFGKAITINSGYRSPEHNANVGGAPQSTHVYGMGFDLTAKDLNALWDAVRLVKQSNKAWIGGMKKYNTFIHVDCWIERTW